MKRVIILTAGLMVLASSVMAQGNMGRGGSGMMSPCFQKNVGMQHKAPGMPGSKMECMLPDLTDAQKEKIEALRTQHMKDAMVLRNQIAEKRAKLNTLRIADKPNTNEINKIIDEIGSLRTKMMKMGESHRQKVRALLTDEQKVMFDRMHMRKDSGCMKGHGRKG